MSEAVQQTMATSPLKIAWKAQTLVRSHLSLFNILKQFSVQFKPQEPFSQQEVWKQTTLLLTLNGKPYPFLKVSYILRELPPHLILVLFALVYLSGDGYTSIWYAQELHNEKGCKELESFNGKIKFANGSMRRYTNRWPFLILSLPATKKEAPTSSPKIHPVTRINPP